MLGHLTLTYKSFDMKDLHKLATEKIMHYTIKMFILIFMLQS